MGQKPPNIPLSLFGIGYATLGMRLSLSMVSISSRTPLEKASVFLESSSSGNIFWLRNGGLYLLTLPVIESHLAWTWAGFVNAATDSMSHRILPVLLSIYKGLFNWYLPFPLASTIFLPPFPHAP